jgi:hypothetical protein
LQFWGRQIPGSLEVPVVDDGQEPLPGRLDGAVDVSLNLIFSLIERHS